VHGIDQTMTVLHIVLSIGETSAPYNEHCLPCAETRRIAICTYFRSSIRPPENIRLFEGDGSLRGFFRALRLAHDELAYDVVHAHSPHVALLFLMAALSRRWRGVPTVVTVHDSFPNYKLRNRLLLLPVFAFFQRVVCCSHVSRSSLPSVYRWLAGSRLCAVQNGVDIARVDRVRSRYSRHPAGQDGLSVVAVSRLVDIKNPSSVLAAFRDGRHESDRLTYIGDGILRSALLTEIANSGLSLQIQLTGLLPREAVFEHLFNADLFVSASRGEGLPIAVLEAMACSCPVVLSDIPPHREIAADVDFIPLVAPDDVKGFAREIERIRQMSAPQRRTLGAQCRMLVEEHFGLPAMHRRYAEVYAQVTRVHAAVLTSELG
jgi:glycosyltransferase involved in cell wall biosynthesis